MIPCNLRAIILAYLPKEQGRCINGCIKAHECGSYEGLPLDRRFAEVRRTDRTGIGIHQTGQDARLP